MSKTKIKTAKARKPAMRLTIEQLAVPHEPIAPTIRLMEPQPAPEMVAHPQHYNRGGIECMQVSAAMVTGWSPQAAYRLGQAHDYIFRHAHKGQPVQDLEKAVFWIQEHIRALKAEETAHG